MKKIFIIITGFSPLLIGYGLHLFITYSTNAKPGIALDLFCILFFLYWGLMGFAFCKFTDSKLNTSILCNFPAFIVLLLILVQELINKRYWTNLWGFITQIFYLPTLRISFAVKPNFLYYMWQSYIISFLLMMAASYIGCSIRAKIILNKNA